MGGRVHIHVTVEPCDLPGCDWTGFHTHWRGRVFRVAVGALTQRELYELDADCAADRADADAAAARERAGQ